MSDCLGSHGLQHARLACPLLFPRACVNSSLLSLWCYPTVSFSVSPFSSCPLSFPALGSFPMSWFFALGGWSVGASASTSVLPMNVQGWLPLGLTGWVSLLSKELSRVFSSTTIWKHLLFGAHNISNWWINIHFQDWENRNLEKLRICQKSFD